MRMPEMPEGNDDIRHHVEATIARHRREWEPPSHPLVQNDPQLLPDGGLTPQIGCDFFLDERIPRDARGHGYVAHGGNKQGTCLLRGRLSGFLLNNPHEMHLEPLPNKLRKSEKQDRELSQSEPGTTRAKESSAHLAPGTWPGASWARAGNALKTGRV